MLLAAFRIYALTMTLPDLCSGRFLAVATGLSSSNLFVPFLYVTHFLLNFIGTN